jgi:UDP-2,4-diacetamido-2,4,6-trideoxy-beta-L-altropyranose hydrolase
VIGENHPAGEALRRQAAERPGTALHRTRPHLADLMAAADLAIGAGGVTTWERMCLGVPSLVISIAENQRPACEALAADGLIAYAGDAASVDVATIRGALSSLMPDRDRLAALSSGGQRLVDGHGAARVADALLA